MTEREQQIGQSTRMLEAKVAELSGTIERLNEELAETNKGVVALYAELDDKAAQLAEASELKSRFLSYMSHEFRTPLGAIRSIARLLLDRMDGPLSVEQEKQVVFIQQSALELTELVNDLLDLAKIEAGRLSISPGWFEMVDLFDALRGMFRPLLEDGQVALIFEEPPALQPIFSDDKKLSQILRNFISNALKFTTAGTVRVGAHLSGGMVTFSVADTGIGIPSEHHARIFEDFTQVDSQLQRKWRGTGLGLSLCKKFADLLGGAVSMESVPGQGSTFRVTLPVQYDVAASSSGVRAAATETAP